VRGACGHVMSYQTVNVAASRDLMPGKNLSDSLKALGWSDWMSRSIPGRGGRRNGKTGGEVMPFHVYHNEERGTVRITLGFSYF
jgi:hypothetical protein